MVSAHDISAANASFVASITGPALFPFLYLGAKHMVTGWDHLLFLIGVVFFLDRLGAVVLYVTLFTIGHSLTLVGGVLNGWQVDAHLVDAVIGLSVVYKAFENLGGFESSFDVRPDMRLAVFGFGLCHGLGLATRLQDLAPDPEGRLSNLMSFNLGVEIGQILALAVVVWLLARWRAHASFGRGVWLANTALMAAGFVLAGSQLTGFVVARW